MKKHLCALLLSMVFVFGACTKMTSEHHDNTVEDDIQIENGDTDTNVGEVVKTQLWVYPVLTSASTMLLAVDGDGNMVAVGHTTDPQALVDEAAFEESMTFILKFSPQGILQQQWLFPDTIVPQAMAVNDQGRMVLATTMDGPVVFADTVVDHVAKGVIFFEFDMEAGRVLSTLAIDEARGMQVSDMVIDPLNDVYVSGSIEHINGTMQNAIVLKVSMTQRQVTWFREFESCGDRGTVRQLAMTDAQQLIGVGNFNCEIHIGSETYQTADSTDNNIQNNFAFGLTADTGIAETSFAFGGSGFDQAVGIDPRYRILSNSSADASFLGAPIDPAGRPLPYLAACSAGPALDWLYPLERFEIATALATDSSDYSAAVGTTPSAELAVARMDDSEIEIGFDIIAASEMSAADAAIDGEGNIWICGQFEDDAMFVLADVETNRPSQFLYRLPVGQK